jgi:hypothetical protein
MAIFGLVILFAGLLMLAVARKFVRGEISRKGYMGMGIKIKEAFASDEAWYRINRGGGKLMIIPSLVFIALGLLIILSVFLFPGYYEAVVIAALVGVIVAMFPLFWYVIWVKQNEQGQKMA